MGEDYSIEVMRAEIDDLRRVNAEQDEIIAELRATLDAAANRATARDEAHDRQVRHLRHTIDVCQQALTGQAVLMGMILEAVGDEVESD